MPLPLSVYNMGRILPVDRESVNRKKQDRPICLLVNLNGRAIIMTKSFVESMPLYHPHTHNPL